MVKSPKQIGQQSSTGGPSFPSILSPFPSPETSTTGLLAFSSISLSPDSLVKIGHLFSYSFSFNKIVLYVDFPCRREERLRCVKEENWNRSSFEFIEWIWVRAGLLSTGFCRFAALKWAHTGFAWYLMILILPCLSIILLFFFFQFLKINSSFV